jgi:hypothetical protein
MTAGEDCFLAGRRYKRTSNPPMTIISIVNKIDFLNILDDTEYPF